MWTMHVNPLTPPPPQTKGLLYVHVIKSVVWPKQACGGGGGSSDSVTSPLATSLLCVHVNVCVLLLPSGKQGN